MTRHTSDRWIRIGGRLLPPVYRAEILTDLVEERDAMRAQGHGRIATTMWMLGHLVRSAVASRLRRRTLPGAPAPGGWRGPGFGRELRQAARSLRKAPWYAVTIVLVTALSMALATTVFAIVDGVLFKPLPYPNPDELYVVSGAREPDRPATGRPVQMTSANELAEWSERLPGTPLTGFSYRGYGLPDGTDVFAVMVDRSFFDVFGVRLLMGGFRDEHFGIEPPVQPILISHRLWQDKLGGDPAVLGRIVPWRQPPLQVVGVLAPDGFLPPYQYSAALARRQNRIDLVMPLADPTSAGDEMVAFARVRDDRLAAATAIFDLVPLIEYTSARERPALALAFGTVMSLVCLVLLNAGALSAARAQQRIRDLSLRRALGARTLDLLRHALAEQSILVMLGTAAGVVASQLLLALVLDRLPPGLNLIKDPRIDWRVLLFAGLVSALGAIVVALLAVRVAVRRATTRPSGDGSPVTTSRAHAGRLLLGAQTAVAFSLILGGALFATSLARIWDEDPGLNLRDLAIMDVSSNNRELSDSQRRARVLELAVRLRRTPGVMGASVLNALVMENISDASRTFRLPDGVPPEAPKPTTVNVGSGFFRTAGIEPVSGRLPTDVELDTGAPVIVVSESLARAYWPERPALGQRLRSRTSDVDFGVIGVVRDVRLVALDVPSEGAIFVPWGQPIGHNRGPSLLVRLAGGSDSLPMVMERIARLDPELRMTDIQMLEDAASETIRERRLSALTASVFASVALVFVAIGILGLVAMTASRRTREVGIRMALGARPAGVVRQLIGEQLGAVIAGIVAGGLMAAWAVRFIQGHLYETAGHDPAVWATTVAVMLVTTTLGAWIPAMRASRVDPVDALRDN